MLRPGDTARGYTVTGLLGEGGMGAVYAAVREKDGLEVAIKVLHQARGEHLARARTEAAAQQLMNHPHVVRVLDVLELDGAPGLVMERVHGPDLRAWLQAGRPSESDALTVFRGIVAGVEHAHHHGLIHRDLKPSNVLLAVSDDGVLPKVADFGLVKLDEGDRHATRTGMMLGTPGYMAPEQIRDAKRADRRADVYALGVLLYELVCGRAPIQSTDVITAYEEMTSRSWPDPSSLGASKPVAAAIRQALEPEPENRPATAAELRALLDPSATFIDDPMEAVWLSSQSPGTARARALSVAASASLVDPTRPALRTPIAAPEGGLVGREDVLTELVRAVNKPGVVVVRGPPGMGKTALARALARREGSRSAWVGGIWWVDLRAATDPAQRLAEVLGLPVGASLGHALGRRGRTLVVLDEVEPVIDALRACLAEWVDDAPGLTLLLTTRQGLALDLAHETVLGPLSEAEGIALFVRRARIHRGDWMPTSDERAEIGELVDQLDGLPLALELAAARARVLSPRELIARLEKRLDVLRTRGEDPRTASLRGAIASSWDTLGEVERSALGWLSVVVGGAAPDAAEALLDPLDPDPLLLLEELEEASWLVVQRGEGGTRYQMLRSLSAFAREALGEDELARASRRHAEVWVPRGERALDAFERTGEGSGALAEDIEDLVVVASRFPKDPIGFRAASVASRWLTARGDVQRSEAMARRALTTAESLGRLVDRAWLELAQSLVHTRPAEAGEAAAEALRRTDDDQIRVRAWVARGVQAASEDGAAELDKAIALARRIGAVLEEGDAWMNKGARAMRAGELAEAERCGEEALSLFRELGQRSREAKALSYLGMVRHRRELWDAAERTLRDAIELADTLGDGKSHAAALGRLSMVLARAERTDEARSALDQAKTISRSLGDRVGEGFCELNLGALTPDPALAAERFRAAAHLARRAGAVHLLAMSERNLATSEVLRGAPERAIEPFERTVAHHASRKEADVTRLGAWLALCRAGCGQIDAADTGLAVLSGVSDEDALIVDLAKLAVDGVRAQDAGSLERIDARMGNAEDHGWDVLLTRNLARAVLRHVGLEVG